MKSIFRNVFETLIIQMNNLNHPNNPDNPNSNNQTCIVIIYCCVCFSDQELKVSSPDADGKVDITLVPVRLLSLKHIQIKTQNHTHTPLQATGGPFDGFYPAEGVINGDQIAITYTGGTMATGYRMFVLKNIMNLFLTHHTLKGTNSKGVVTVTPGSDIWMKIGSSTNTHTHLTPNFSNYT